MNTPAPSLVLRWLSLLAAGAHERRHLRGMFTPSSTRSPARPALHTGLFPIRPGAYPNHPMVAPATKRVCTQVNALGLRTALFGKPHIPPKTSLPFENFGNDPDDAETLAADYAEISQFDTQVGAAPDALERAGQAKHTFRWLLTEQGSQMPGGGKWTLSDNGICVSAFARWPERIKAGSTSDAMMHAAGVPARCRSRETPCPNQSCLAPASS